MSDARALIVDDDPSFAKGLKALVSQTGFSVEITG